MSLIFDSHAHYDDPAFDEDRDRLLRAFPSCGVSAVINAASDLASSHAGIRLAETYPAVWAAVGIHPQEAGRAALEDEQELRGLTVHPRVVAIGEIGLDYHYAEPSRQTQLNWFRRQLQLAAECRLPVIIHDRDAHEDTLRLLREFRPAGVIHCFSGSVEMAREVTELGMYIGLGGAVTFKNARKPVEVAAAVPLDRLVLETDAPYMAPVPYRGKRCDSRLIAATSARIAAIRGMEQETLLDAARANACRLFRISPDALPDAGGAEEETP